jgi:hypothetical protein
VNGTRRVRNRATALDREGLAAIFDYLACRILLGAIDCGDCLELVFSLDGDVRGANLVTVYTEGRARGYVSLGGVAEPLEYVRAARWGV